MPVRNGENYLCNALSDIQRQTFPDFELLISDNGSDDATESISREVARSDPRVTYVRQPENLGAAANYNFVFHNTSAPLFRWASHDDGCAPNHLERCVDAYDELPRDTSLVYPRTTLIDANGDETGTFQDNLNLPWPSPRRRLVHFTLNWQLCNAIMGVMRREAAERTRLIDTFVSSDVVTLAELALQGPMIELPEPLFHRRIHAGSAMQGGNTDAATWLDPKAAPASGKARYSTMPLLGQTLHSILHEDEISRAERAWIGAWVSGAWIYRRTRVNGGRLKARALHHDGLDSP